jgi:toxin YoeB
MVSLSFLPEAADLRSEEDYIFWQGQDKKTVNKINHLLQDVTRNGYSGIGKPEPLKENMSG